MDNDKNDEVKLVKLCFIETLWFLRKIAFLFSVGLSNHTEEGNDNVCDYYRFWYYECVSLLNDTKQVILIWKGKLHSFVITVFSLSNLWDFIALY